jgi:PKD repeat protein
MKKITTSLMALMLTAITFGQSFFVPTTYRGAFAPAPAAQWTDTWTNWDPQNTVYGASTVTVTQSITTNTTWTSGNVYLLQGQIYVKNGATLTIQPGTIIQGDKATAGSGLFVCQGSKLIANGTANQPIVFTSNQAPGARLAGDWGGIILMGKSHLNLAGGIGNIEGLTVSPDTQFGGGANPDTMDNSGSLKYVRIEFPGYVYQPNKEINGLTLGAVGKGTMIDYVQVSFSNDDAYEWFGGTVDCRHLVSYRNLDDDFDTDNGFSGNVQFCLGVRDPLIADVPAVSTSEGFESDNDATGSVNLPQTKAAFSNVTWIGPLRGTCPASSVGINVGYRKGARIRRNSALKIYNSIFMDGLQGFHVDGTLSENNATAGSLKFKNNIIAGYLTNLSLVRNTGSTFNMWTNFTSNSNDSTACSTNLLTLPYGVGGNYQTPDYRPIVGSAALSNVSFVDSYLAGRSIQAPASNATVAYCQGDVATALTATASTGCTIVWYTQATGGAPIPTPTPTTAVAGSSTYYVAQQDANGYEGPRTMVTVTINATPSTPVITASGSTSFCTGGNVVLTSSTPMGNLWSNGANTVAITVTTSGSYTVTYTNANGCTATSVATVVNVNNAPVPTVQASSIEACDGDTVTITASTSDTYLWSTGATTQSINVTSTTANVTVLVTNANACNGVGTSAPISITFNANPTAVGSFTTNGNVATFANTSTGATSYSWDFGDMTNSSAAAPIHAYAANGSYTVTLTAINGNCSDVTTFNVNIAVSLDELPGVALSLVPNPATTSFNVALTGASLELVTVIDAFGRTILNSTEATINLNQVANGMYNVVVSTNKGTSVRKLIVNN